MFSGKFTRNTLALIFSTSSKVTSNRCNRKRKAINMSSSSKRKAGVSKTTDTNDSDTDRTTFTEGEAGPPAKVMKASSEKFTPFFGKTSPFSQHFPCSFELDGNMYCTAEQYMMHQKAVVFKDIKMAEQILLCNDPAKQKKLGRQVKNFDPVTWNQVCEDVVKKANMAKFSQNASLRSRLQETTGTTLVEASPRDRIWGVGLGCNNPKIHNRKNWRGKNLLGKILTEVRTELAKSQESSSPAAKNV